MARDSCRTLRLSRGGLGPFIFAAGDEGSSVLCRARWPVLRAPRRRRRRSVWAHQLGSANREVGGEVCGAVKVNQAACAGLYKTDAASPVRAFAASWFV